MEEIEILSNGRIIINTITGDFVMFCEDKITCKSDNYIYIFSSKTVEITVNDKIRSIKPRSAVLIGKYKIYVVSTIDYSCIKDSKIKDAFTKIRAQREYEFSHCNSAYTDIITSILTEKNWN